MNTGASARSLPGGRARGAHPRVSHTSNGSSVRWAEHVIAGAINLGGGSGKGSARAPARGAGRWAAGGGAACGSGGSGGRGIVLADVCAWVSDLMR